MLNHDAIFVLAERLDFFRTLGSQRLLIFTFAKQFHFGHQPTQSRSARRDKELWFSEFGRVGFHLWHLFLADQLVRVKDIPAERLRTGAQVVQEVLHSQLLVGLLSEQL